jgi:molybdenum cofactor biosynthesis protein B
MGMKSNHIQPLKVQVSILTVSTTRTTQTDVSGSLIADLITKAGIEIKWYAIIPDKVEHIQEALRSALEHSNCIIFCGGTGLTEDDCTIEAVNPLVQKRIDGFGELFRWLSFQEIGTAAILSRAFAGIIEKKAVFCLPGSPNAARLAVSVLIIPEISHILSHARK